MPTTAAASAARATYCAHCDATVAVVEITPGQPHVPFEYDVDGYTVSAIRHVCGPRDERVGRLILARRAAASTARAAA